MSSVFNPDEFKSCMLEKNRIYHVKVHKVTSERGRTFIKPGTNKRMHVFDVYMEDGNGKYQAEYASETAEQDVIFEGIVQYLQCTQSGKIADEVAPYDPANAVVPPETLKRIADENRTLSIGGTSYSCAIICAKDIICAEMNSNPGALFDEECKGKLFDIAEEIDLWLRGKRDGL